MASYSQYPLIDDAGKIDGFQSGLRFHNGKKKPSVFARSQRPFYARQSGSRVELFGAIRWPSGGSVTLQTRTSKKGKWKSLGNATLNSRGYFDKRVKVSRVSKRYFRFVGRRAAGEPRGRRRPAGRERGNADACQDCRWYGAPDERQTRLDRARLYLVIEAGAARAVVPAALAGGVDVVQLRDKHAPDEEIVAAGRELRELCDDAGALLVVNDRADLALACDADGVHVGQDDEPVAQVRRARRRRTC